MRAQLWSARRPGVVATFHDQRHHNNNNNNLSSATSLSLPSRHSSAALYPPRASSLRSSITSAASSHTAPPNDLMVDLVVVGGGIIGLMTAHALLMADPALSVVVLDAKEPCAGATGAGQGYIWLCHRDVASPAYEVAVRSKTLWQQQLQGGLASLMKESDIDWQQNGSMLIASNAEEADKLKEREENLRNAGIDATFMSAGKARELEPALNFPSSGTFFNTGAALIVPNDAQINGRKTAAAVLAACRLHSASGRFQDLFFESCEGLATSSTGRVEGVVTPLRTIMARSGVVMAAGAWGGPFLARYMNKPQWATALMPRRGLLLEMPRPNNMPKIHRGLMEVGYTQHYNASTRSKIAEKATETTSTPADITFTATTSASGSLLVGSSREFSGWDSSGPIETVNAIMDRATMFLPSLADVDRTTDISVRVGLRPFSKDGPMVGPLCEGLFIASGHEGSGLTLGLATAELIVEDILGREGHALSAEAVACLRPSPDLMMMPM